MKSASRLFATVLTFILGMTAPAQATLASVSAQTTPVAPGAALKCKLPAHSILQPQVSNPQVEAGKIRWHASFQAACEASKKSGKPVFLFQMMGRLDQEFC